MTLRNNSKPENCLYGMADGYEASSCALQIFILYKQAGSVVTGILLLMGLLQ